jgi:hypothetical protein
MSPPGPAPVPRVERLQSRQGVGTRISPSPGNKLGLRVASDAPLTSASISRAKFEIHPSPVDEYDDSRLTQNA